ncbi:hypothetical protein BDQ17DRAFT_1547448 [Cyathus striatus]|nr:hypothetical protein BDQ17DRAFT_1547448 [Cyathus striatus]
MSPPKPLVHSVKSEFQLLSTPPWQQQQQTKHDSWRHASSSVTATEVFKTIKANTDTSRLVAATVG